MRSRALNVRAIRALVRRDLMVVARNRGVVIPMLMVPVVIMVVVPVLMALAPTWQALWDQGQARLAGFLQNLPEDLARQTAGMSEAQSWVTLALGYMMAPLYLILPLMVASVVAADSYAGEKERKTLEALLYTPTTDRELFLAKLLSAWVPAVVVALGSFALYAVAANVAGWPVMGRIFFPNSMWLVVVLWVAPAVAGFGLGVTVLVSARAQSFQEAYQLGGVVVLPLVALTVAQATGAMYLSTGLVFLVGLLFWGIDAVLLSYGGRTFRRERLAAGRGST